MPKINPAISQMTANQINSKLDKLDKLDSKLTDAMIEAGRGYERPSDWEKMSDPLAKKLQQAYRDRMDLRNEIERRYGPGAPSRLPRGFGPIKRNPGMNSQQLTKAFHGRDVREEIDVSEQELYATEMAVLGILVELNITRDEGKSAIPIRFETRQGQQYKKDWVFACAPDEDNIEFIGGNQEIGNVSKLVDINGKRYLKLGHAESIVYLADKHHLQDSDGNEAEYQHEFGKKSMFGFGKVKGRPLVVYDVLNKTIKLVGGSYTIRDVGIVD